MPQKIKHRKRNEKNKYMETKKINGSNMNSKKKLKNTLKQMPVKTQSNKIYRMQQKQFL